tara:strand:+ start:1881 stop:2078 length:198 start_codon:yes stop_codon:yes gene_type:complete
MEVSQKFVITAYEYDGDTWETVRHTEDGMNNVIQQILEDGNIMRYTVEEKTSFAYDSGYTHSFIS